MIANFISTIKSYHTVTPAYFSIFFLLVCVVGLLSALFDANWLFGSVSGVTYNLKKIDGWVNLFGRK
jgi:hypothetical protein